MTKVAVIQGSPSPRQDPFMGDYDPAKVRPQSEAHFNKLLKLFVKAGKMGADIVCGPEDMQNIGAYGLHIDVKDPETDEILFISLATPVPGTFTDRVSKIARDYNMYIIAPIYEREQEKVYNTSVIFDRNGGILGKYRKTNFPVMETWLVSPGNEHPVFQTDFGTIAIATCWEIVFPEISTIYSLKGADIIFNPTMGKENKDPSLASAPRYLARAMDNFVYIAPVILGSNGSGIIDFDGNVIAEAPGVTDTVIMAEIDFSKEAVLDSEWWTTINGTDNRKAIHFLSRRPELYIFLSEPDPPVLNTLKDIKLTTGDRERQLKAVREVDYGPNQDK
jgi:predicted amidohydrolase